jgi:transcriptional regulator with XRE-family HTH domain
MIKKWGAVMPLGENIKKARENAGLTQKDLAQKIGKGFSTVQKYELNLVDPPIEVLNKLADALDVPIFYLLDTQPPKSAFGVGMDWLESLGWKVVVYEEEEYRTVLLRNTESCDQYLISDEMLRQLIDGIASFSKYQIQELIKSCKKFGE